jgi:hypothetical protein
MQFPCKIGFRSFDTYLNSSLPMKIISRNEYIKIMVNELEYQGDNIFAYTLALPSKIIHHRGLGSPLTLELLHTLHVTNLMT